MPLYLQRLTETAKIPTRATDGAAGLDLYADETITIPEYRRAWGFAEFRRQLTYKATMTGAHVHVVDRFFPSSKTCHSCGTIHPMKLSERVMVCDCGMVLDRDLNAALNLKQHAASSAVSACGEEGSGHGSIVTKPASVKQETVDRLSNEQVL